MEEASSKFNINIVRDIFLHGEAHHVALIQKLIKGYYFLQPKDLRLLGAEPRQDTFFVVAAVDFGNVKKLQDVARAFELSSAPLVHRLIYAVAPQDLPKEALLFAQEIGARYVACGPGKNDDLKDYLKRVCSEAHQVGSLAAFEDELTKAFKSADRASTTRLIEKLKALPFESEEATRLLAIAHQYLGDLKRTETYLKKLLAINSQNLWAANTLGRLLLRSGRAAQGIEVLEKLSQFHDINSERHLTLGDAYVQANLTAEARQAYKKGEALVGQGDERFEAGHAKVKLAEGDFDGALAVLQGKSFSRDVISFLNMRAIMAMRGGRHAEGLNFYSQAVKGSGEAKEIKAKVLFNMGLAYVRMDDLQKAQELFLESCQIGGPQFQRARGPLDVVKGVLKNKERGKTSTPKESMELIDEVEWETLF